MKRVTWENPEVKPMKALWEKGVWYPVLYQQPLCHLLHCALLFDYILHQGKDRTTYRQYEDLTPMTAEMPKLLRDIRPSIKNREMTILEQIEAIGNLMLFPQLKWARLVLLGYTKNDESVFKAIVMPTFSGWAEVMADAHKGNEYVTEKVIRLGNPHFIEEAA